MMLDPAQSRLDDGPRLADPSRAVCAQELPFLLPAPFRSQTSSLKVQLAESARIGNDAQEIRPQNVKPATLNSKAFHLHFPRFSFSASFGGSRNLQACTHGCQCLTDTNADLNIDAAMVDLSEHLKRARAARWAKATKKEKQEAASNASRAFWDTIPFEERRRIMIERAKKRKKKR